MNMKAGIITAAGRAPVYGDFDEPVANSGNEIITVSASALSQFSKSRSSGSHYSSERAFPSVAGADGVGRTAEGRRVYFALPEPPFGALAEKCLVDARRCVAVPDDLDDVTAAAIANPGMSAWAALVERARLQRGETVLVNGATSSAGRIAVQLAKHLGAAKVIGTGRNRAELEEIRALGADVVVPFDLSDGNEAGAEEYERPLMAEFASGIDVVIDYVWGKSARTTIVAIAKAVEDAHPVRFVHVGGVSREENIELPGAALRSSAIQLMGSGVKSVPFPKLLEAVAKVFETARPANLQIATKTLPLSAIEEAWRLPNKPRIVITI
jgi:NADPH:quinone reductase-like Zn-dependent oxidoreductase